MLVKDHPIFQLASLNLFLLPQNALGHLGWLELVLNVGPFCCFYYLFVMLLLIKAVLLHELVVSGLPAANIRLEFLTVLTQFV